MSRAEISVDAICAVKRASADLYRIVADLEDISISSDDYTTPDACRCTAEHLRDMALLATAAVASLQSSAGMLRALSYERAEVRHGA